MSEQQKLETVVSLLARSVASIDINGCGWIMNAEIYRSKGLHYCTYFCTLYEGTTSLYKVIYYDNMLSFWLTYKDKSYTG